MVKFQDFVHKKDAYAQTDLTGEDIVKLQNLVNKFNKDVQNLNENLYRSTDKLKDASFSLNLSRIMMINASSIPD